MTIIEILTLLDAICKFILFLIFCYASYRHFTRDISEPLGMRFIRISSLVLILTNIIALIFFNENIGAFLLFLSSILFIVSLLLFTWCLITTRNKLLRLAYSDTSSDSLIISGPYRYLRHPFYTAYILYWLSWLPLTGWNIVSVVFTLVLTAQYILAIITEERHLRRRFPQSYQNYASTTPLLIPWLL